MMKYRNIFLVMILMGISVLTANSAIDVNQPAPNFTLTDSKGATHSLENYKGKYVVLEWVNYECPFVAKHYNSQNMQGLQKDLTDKGVVWFSINSSAEGKQGYFQTDKINQLIEEKEASPTAYLIDTKGEVGKMYNAQTTPHMFIINPEGNVIYQGAIDDNPSWDPADVAESKNYVLAAINNAMSGNPISIPSTKSYGCSVKY